jgi:hypothetical protein
MASSLLTVFQAVQARFPEPETADDRGGDWYLLRKGRDTKRGHVPGGLSSTLLHRGQASAGLRDLLYSREKHCTTYFIKV